MCFKKKGLAQSLGNPIIRSILILTVSKGPTPTSVQAGKGSEKSTPLLSFGWNARAEEDFLPRRQRKGKSLPPYPNEGGGHQRSSFIHLVCYDVIFMP